MAPQGSDILALLGYASLTLLVILCVLVIVHSFRIPMDARRHATCGGCGYPLTDVSAGRCPECGGSLVRVGVVTPLAAVRLRSSVPKLVLAWAALWAAALPFAFNRVIPLLNVPPTPIGRRTYLQGEISAIAARSDGQPAYRIGIVVDLVRTMDGTMKSGSITLWHQDWEAQFDRPPSLAIEAPQGNYTVVASDGSSIAKGGMLDAAGVQALFNATGHGDSLPTDDDVADLKTLVSGFFNNAATTEFVYQLQRFQPPGERLLRASTFAGGNSGPPETVFADPALSPQTIVIAFWTTSALIWLIGLFVMLRLRRRLLIAATPSPAPS